MLMAWTPLCSVHGHPDSPLEPDPVTDHPFALTPQGPVVAPRQHPPGHPVLWAARSTPPT